MATTAAAQEVAPRIFDIRDRVTVVDLPAEASVLSLWCPLVSDAEHQRVLDFRIDSTLPFEIHHDASHGNQILYVGFYHPLPNEVELTLRFRVERRDRGRPSEPASFPDLPDSRAFARFLAPERHVEVTPEIERLSRDLRGNEPNIIEQARRFYDYVVGYMTYDAEQQSWVGSSEHALSCSVGNCNDIHALFIALCRAAQIPARFVLGQALEPPPSGEESCEVCGYHCWAEFFAPGAGWLPVDASCACKYGKHALFGELETNHVAWSIGRDILLQPLQQGEPLLFFVAPYAEVDGRPHAAIRRYLTFS